MILGIPPSAAASALGSCRAARPGGSTGTDPLRRCTLVLAVVGAGLQILLTRTCQSIGYDDSAFRPRQIRKIRRKYLLCSPLSAIRPSLPHNAALPQALRGPRE